MRDFRDPLFAERYPIALGAGLLDFALIFASAYIAFFLRFHHLEMNELYFMATLAISLLLIIAQIISKSYATWRGQGLIQPLKKLVFGWLMASGFVFSALVLLKLGHYFSRIWLGSYLFIAFILVLSSKLIFFWCFQWARKKGKNLKQVLILTDLNKNHSVFFSIDKLKNHGHNIKHTLTINPSNPDLPNLEKKTHQMQVHEIWICLPLNHSALVQSLALTLHNHLADIRYFPDLSDLPLLNQRFNIIGNMQTIDISCSAMDGPNRLLIRSLDLILGSLFFIILLPVAAIIYFLVKLSSPGPAIFKQYRMGINGRTFKVYKFRTMKMHQEKDNQVTKATKNDTRVNKIGANHSKPS